MGGGWNRPVPGKHKLEFREIKDTGKTKVWRVVSTFQHDLPDVEVGTIKWWGAWRKYVFFPDSETLYDVGCMSQICEFITERMEERKAKKKASKK